MWEPWIEVHLLLVLGMENGTLLFSLSYRPPQSQWDSVSSDPANISVMSGSIGWPETGNSSAYLTTFSFSFRSFGYVEIEQMCVVEVGHVVTYME